MNFKEKKDLVLNLAFNLNLGFILADREKFTKLVESYFRKRTNIVNSDINNLCGGLLWVYSRINFLFENNKDWSQQNIAELLGIRAKTISNIAGKIMFGLKINVFDDRFARKEISDNNPMNKYVMTESGFIIHKDDLDKIISKKFNGDSDE